MTTLILILSTCCARLVLSQAHPAQADICEWPRVDARRITKREFESKYLERQPVLLENMLDGWPALELWSRENILSKFGSYQFNSSHIASNCRVLGGHVDGITLQEHLSSGKPQSWFIEPHAPIVKKLQKKPGWSRPKLFEDLAGSGPFVSIGSKGQGNIFHTHANNWLAQLQGRKRWLVFPADAKPFDDIYNTRLFEPCAPRPREGWHGLTECTAKQGDVVYLPSQWYHETCSLDNFSIGVAYLRSDGYLETALSRKFQRALLDGDKAFMEGALKHDAKRVIDDLGTWSGMDMAAYHGHHDILSLLLEHRADAKALHHDRPGWRPVHWAAEGGHVAALRLLKKFGASLSVDAEGKLPKELASGKGHLNALKFLHRPETACTKCQHAAANSGHLSILRHLLEQNSLESDVAPSLLASAVSGGQSEAVDFVLNLQTAELDLDAFHEASRNAAAAGHLRALDSLASHNVTLFSMQGETLAKTAIRSGHRAIARYLSGQGVKFGRNLHIKAAEAGHTVITDYLRRHHSKDDAKNLQDMELLNVAIRKGHVRLVDQILSWPSQSSTATPEKLRKAADKAKGAIAKKLKEAARLRQQQQEL